MTFRDARSNPRPAASSDHSRQVFVWEYACGGACAEASTEPSLRREGRAMLLAVLDDLTGLAGVRPVTMWDARLGRFPVEGVDAIIVEGPVDEAAAFDQLAEGSDVSLIIAPEFDDILYSRSRRVLDCGGRLAGCLPDAITLCGDKLLTCRRLRDAGIPTIATRPFDPDVETPALDGPIVLKPRQGAGSLATRLIRDWSDFEIQKKAIAAEAARFPLIQQPYVPGRAVSVAAVLSQNGRVVMLAPGDQRLSTDGRFAYRGGRIPAELDARTSHAVCDVARRAAMLIEGLRGYVGFDLIVPDDGTTGPVVVDINPRLTTAYVGYRQYYRAMAASRHCDCSTQDADAEVDPQSYGGDLALGLLGLQDESSASTPAASQCCIEFGSDGRFRQVSC